MQILITSIIFNSNLLKFTNCFFFYQSETLIIEGELQVLSSQSLTLRAKSIWVIGALIAGSPTLPYLLPFTIQLIGEMNQTKFFNYNDKLLQASRLMLVTGFINLFGVPISTPFSFLQLSASPSTSFLALEPTPSYPPLSVIILGSSDPPYDNFEYLTFEELLSNGEMRVTPSIQNFHFGSKDLAESELRTVVAVVGRNIVIEEEERMSQQNDDEEHILVMIVTENKDSSYGPENFYLSILDHVMIHNCYGKCLQINGGRTKIKGSSVGGGGIEMKGGERVEMEGNLIYDCKGVMVKVDETEYFKFDRNVMVGMFKEIFIFFWG